MKRPKQIGVIPQPPHVAPGAQYGQKAALAAAKHTDPVGGGAAPPIPRLDQTAVPGLTMAAQARRPTPDQLAQARGILTNSEPQSDGRPAILTTDLLPDAAKKDPRYAKGMGSELAAANPELAYQYGIIRNGQHLMLGHPAVQQQEEPPRQGRLSEKTLEGLQRIAEDQRKRLGGAEVNTVPDKTEGTEAVEAATPPAATPDKEELQELLNSMDNFDLSRLQSETRVNIYNNAEQRKRIEARLKPLSIDELLMNNTVKQKVVIVPPGNGSQGFAVTYEHVSGTTDLKFKEMVSRACRTLDMGDAYFNDLYALLTLAASVHRINDVVFPDYRKDNGEVDETRMWERFKRVAGNILPMLAVLSVNYTWFDDRVRRLFVAEDVKNG